MNPDYKNILVVCIRKIGDVVISTSIAYLLKQAYPNAKVTMLVKPLTQEIVINNPVVDEVMLYNYTHKSSFAEMRQVAQEIKVKKFDLCIIADNKPRSAMIACLAGIPKRVGFEHIEFRNIYLKLFYTDIIKIDYDAKQTLQAKNHEIFINRFTGRNDRAQMIMSEVSVESKVKIDSLVENFIYEHNLKNPLRIALCIRSGCLTKDWSINWFAEVVNRLNTMYNAVFYVIGSPADLVVAEEFNNLVNAKVRLLCGQTSLGELGYLLEKSDLFLTVDTGSAHIAATTGVPMVTVFGSTSPKKWGPYTEKAICLAPDCACHPCDGTKIKCKLPKCLETIQIEDVVKACAVQLKTYKKCLRK
jgi:lipopolysaccharide heptosyltransferase II